MKHLAIIIFTSIIILTLPLNVHADRRIFGYTYPYQTLPQGTLELEHYLDMGLNDWDNPDTPEDEDDWSQIKWKHQVEFEYGITDHLDFGLYNVFSQKPFGNFGYDGLKLRSRYRFAEQGQLIVDPAIYFEIGYYGDSVKLEEMLILGKRIANVEISFNGKLEQKYKINDDKWEFEFLPILGIGYHFNNNFALSIEYYGKAKIKNGELDYFVNYMGPALSVAGESFYWTVAIQPQIGTQDDLAAVQIRSVFGAIF